MSATRMNDCNRPQAVLHMALELGEVTWKLGFTMGLGQKPRRRDSRPGAYGLEADADRRWLLAFGHDEK
jgi:hypothetical protein